MNSPLRKLRCVKILQLREILYVLGANFSFESKPHFGIGNRKSQKNAPLGKNGQNHRDVPTEIKMQNNVPDKPSSGGPFKTLVPRGLTGRA